MYYGKKIDGVKWTRRGVPTGECRTQNTERRRQPANAEHRTQNAERRRQKRANRRTQNAIVLLGLRSFLRSPVGTLLRSVFCARSPVGTPMPFAFCVLCSAFAGWYASAFCVMWSAEGRSIPTGERRTQDAEVCQPANAEHRTQDAEGNR